MTFRLLAMIIFLPCLSTAEGQRSLWFSFAEVGEFCLQSVRCREMKKLLESNTTATFKTCRLIVSVEKCRAQESDMNKLHLQQYNECFQDIRLPKIQHPEGVCDPNTFRLKTANSSRFYYNDFKYFFQRRLLEFCEETQIIIEQYDSLRSRPSERKYFQPALDKLLEELQSQLQEYYLTQVQKPCS